MPLEQATLDKLSAYLVGRGVALGYLFGSVTRGEDGALSDVDVAVAYNPRLSRDQEWQALLDLSGSVPGIVRREADVVVLNSAPPLLRYEAIRDGVLLVNRDEAFRIHFEVAATREYLDTEHLRQTPYSYLFEEIREFRQCH